MPDEQKPAPQPTLTINELNEAWWLLRQRLASVIDPENRDLNEDCGWPGQGMITVQMYREMYDREGIGARVVQVYPEESWAMDPIIYNKETEGSEPTPFEVVWGELSTALNIPHYLQRIDELSGIGSYGVLLLGFDDGGELSQPVDGYSEEEGENTPEHRLLYLRPFDESLVAIASFETDEKSPRYGQPTSYRIKFSDPNQAPMGSMQSNVTADKVVHWHRVLHVVDNRTSSEVFGKPRMMAVYNRLCDIRKVLGGSAEMFWKGGFPGYSFETIPELGEVEINHESVKEQVSAYQNKLQRYFTLEGLTVKPLSPQVASPEYHIKQQLHAITITLGVPMRVFLGSEESKLSSNQDALTWNKRLARRQNKYLTPMLIRPFVDRLINVGVLPRTAYKVAWPDLNTSTDQDRADTAAKRATALATYVGGGCDQVVPPREFMMHFLGMDKELVDVIEGASDKYVSDIVTPAEAKVASAAKNDVTGGANKPGTPTRRKPAA